jgi:hypothetical protein
MAVIVLLLWAVTAGAGLRLLFTSGLGGRRPARAASAQATPARATPAEATPAPESAMASATAPVSGNAYVPGATKPMSGRAARQAYYDPPTLRRNKNEPIPGLGPLLEFTHPMFAIVGLAFWLGYTLVHARPLAWIAFGLAVATICAGITWFTANARAAKRRQDDSAPGPAFSARLLAIHGGAAVLTFALAALTALTARG